MMPRCKATLYKCKSLFSVLCCEQPLLVHLIAAYHPLNDDSRRSRFSAPYRYSTISWQLREVVGLQFAANF